MRANLSPNMPPTMKIMLRHGLTVPLPGPPEQAVEDVPAPARVALLGADMPGIRPELLVAEGERVAAGQPLARDRRRPGIVFTAPVAGHVEEIALGARRRLASLVIAAEGDESRDAAPPELLDRDAATALLLHAGLWPALSTRPFGRIPDPGAVPAAIFVTAVDTRPHAPDPRVVLAGAEEAFARGVTLLGLLTDGPVHLCQAPGPPLAPPEGRTRVVEVAGPHPAGLPGTHVRALAEVAPATPVWQIGYQDVAAIGTLLMTGAPVRHRVVALSGPGIRVPRLVRVPLGADLHELARREMTPGDKTILSGSVLGGRESRWLRRGDLQVTVLDRRPAAGRRHWLLAALDRAARPAPLIPTAALDAALAADFAAVPLLRAISIGDAGTAEKLGVLALLEEDMALPTYAAGSGVDFAPLLRRVLDGIEGVR